MPKVQTYEEGVGCGVWILGKWMEPKKIQVRRFGAAGHHFGWFSGCLGRFRADLK